MADVPDDAWRECIWRVTSAQTDPWSESCPRPSRADRVTDSLSSLRSLYEAWVPDDPNCRDVYRHRPCSTHDTGRTARDWAATRTDVLSTRFCLAPRSSSPSRN